MERTRLGEARVGCSGWMYEDWRGIVYPEGLPQRRWFEHDATLSDTVDEKGPSGDHAGGGDVEGHTKKELYERAKDLGVQAAPRWTSSSWGRRSHASRADVPRPGSRRLRSPRPVDAGPEGGTGG